MLSNQGGVRERLVKTAEIDPECCSNIARVEWIGHVENGPISLYAEQRKCRPSDSKNNDSIQATIDSL